MFTTSVLLASLGALLGAGERADSTLPSSYSWHDFDRDGRLDAFVLAASGQGVLLKNLANGFRDVTAEAGLLGIEEARSAAWQDVDADGTSDLLVSGPGGLMLFLGGADGRFVDVSQTSGLPVELGARAASWFDYDSDGLADLLLVSARGEELFHNLGAGRFQLAPGAVPGFVADPTAFGAMGAPAEPAPALRRGTPDPNGTLAATAVAGLGGASSVPPRAAAAAVGLCAGSIMDTALGGCLIASSVPMLGALMPLSIDLNVDPSGQVGVGTTNPGAKLDVVGNLRSSGRLISTVNTGPPLVVASDARVDGLNADRLDGLDASAFSQLGNLIESNEIATGAVIASKLAANSVGTFTIADGAIGNADINANAAIQGTKIDPDFGSQDLVTGGTGEFAEAGGLAGSKAAVVGRLSGSAVTRGYLAANGQTNFDGISSADLSGLELGVLGIADDAGTSDNYGVFGHSNNHGVYGQWSIDPGNWGALGQQDFGVRGQGYLAGGRFGNGISLDGVRGFTTDSIGYGVWGRSSFRAVFGEATTSGAAAVYAGGDLTATGTKAFVNPHPNDPAKELRFVCLEGIESGTYFRGSARLAGGVAVIEVPEEFRLGTSPDQPLTVQLTAVGAPARLWVESKGIEGIVVRGDLDVEVDVLVHGVRRGFEEHQVVRENTSYVPLDDGVPFGAQYPESLRRILVANGLLNADYTPNPATMEALEASSAVFATRRDAQRRELEQD